MSETAPLTVVGDRRAPRGRTSDTSPAPYLAALFADEPPGSLVELRYRRGTGMGRSFYGIDRLTTVAAEIQQRAPRTDVYIGVLPRRRRGGGRDDLVRDGRVVWVDCDTPDAVAALRCFALPPSMVVRSGTGKNCHAYWLLSRREALDTIERANRQLAEALGADRASADAARILRPAPSWSHKHRPPAAVRLAHSDLSARHQLVDIVSELADPLQRPSARRRESPTAHAMADPLLAIAPREYVERLAGIAVPRHGKVRCPFHDDGTPSLHVYRDHARGWYCYGCGRGGSVYDFAALLWSCSTTRGRGFIGLDRGLRRIFGV